MNDLRKAALMALDALEAGPDVDPIFAGETITALRAALLRPDESFCKTHCTLHQHHPDCFMARTEKGPVTYTDDVTRIMREAGMTFHLGLPHKAVIEQMTRVVDLVCAEASIKAAQKFAVALAQPEPEPVAWWDGKESVVFTHNEIYTPNWTDYWTQPLYTAPPQRNALPLSDDEIKCIKPICADFVSFRAGVRHAEREHGIGGES